MRYAFPIAATAVVLLAILLFWLWWSDAVPTHKCEQAGGQWDAEARICRITLDPVRATLASRRD